MANIKFHTEQTLLNVLHQHAKETTVCRVAVSYCGSHGRGFFPKSEVDHPEELRIVVDCSELAVRRGLTNPRGVLDLLGLTSKVRSLQGLHAKVFIFDDRVALVGSANMSKHSIEKQYQAILEVSGTAAVHDLAKWFDKTIWSEAHKLTPEKVRKLEPEWQKTAGSWGNHGGSSGKTHGKMPSWADATHPPLSPADFSIGVSKKEIKRLLTEFSTNECDYENDGSSCADVALSIEKREIDRGKNLRSLFKRRKSWTKNDLRELFNLAYTLARAAHIKKPIFLRQSPVKVARSVQYLLEGPGDPYIRIAKVLSPKSPYKLDGMAKAGVVYLMHLWRPKQFPILNASVEKALTALGVTFDQKASSSDAQVLKHQTAVVQGIAKVTGLKTFARVDHFLDAIGKEHISTPRTS